MKRFLEYDPFSGITTSFEYDSMTDTTILHREQDISKMLDMNKALQNEDEHTKRGIKSGWWHYANIPNIIIEKWLNELGVNVYDKDHEKKVYSLLNQPEYRYLKTTTKMHWGS
jgi:hypothetical protein